MPYLSVSYFKYNGYFMSNDDPMLGGKPKVGVNNDQTVIANKIIKLVRSQSYGVLCTTGKEHAYGSLLAYATVGDLSSIIFATPTTTRKYQLLKEQPKVAFLIDNRDTTQHNFMQVEAITAMGIATQLEKNELNKPIIDFLTAKHPYLSNMLNAESFVLFKMQVLRYFYVTRFQEVMEWAPPQNSSLS